MISLNRASATRVQSLTLQINAAKDPAFRAGATLKAALNSGMKQPCIDFLSGLLHRYLQVEASICSSIIYASYSRRQHQAESFLPVLVGYDDLFH
jgi:hypothetical protein